jgi:hypothetical protein
MGKITVREPHPDDPIYREGLRMYSVRLGPRRGPPAGLAPVPRANPSVTRIFVDIALTRLAFIFSISSKLLILW